jgi:hypothetical protein
MLWWRTEAIRHMDAFDLTLAEIRDCAHEGHVTFEACEKNQKNQVMISLPPFKYLPVITTKSQRGW